MGFPLQLVLNSTRTVCQVKMDFKMPAFSANFRQKGATQYRLIAWFEFVHDRK